MFFIYFDYTGAGRGPEPIAGPFNTRKETEDYADEMEYDLTDSDYFIDKDTFYCDCEHDYCEASERKFFSPPNQ